jgi:uncharacterized protein (TIGR03083 family)
MLLTPRYDGSLFLTIDGSPDDVLEPLTRQRRRLLATLAELDDAQWAAPSRCEGWSVQDVIAHLCGTNQFWAVSIACGRQGAPSQFLAAVGFDPVATPEQMVDAVRHEAPAATLARFDETNAALAESLVAITEAEWMAPAEAPLGHVPLCAVVAHALWDSWIHERDIVVPLGLDPVVEPDEVALSLVYVTALSPGFLAAGGSTRTGVLAVDAVDPDVHFVVEVGPTVTVRGGDGVAGTARVEGAAVDLVEHLSFRRPLVLGLDPTEQWMLGGLAEAFDVPPNRG